MAAMVLEPSTPVQHIQHERFTTEEHGYRLSYLSLDSSGNIAVSGDHYSSRRTYIDLFSGNKSDSRDKLKLFYSKEFEKYSDYWYRCVSFLDQNVGKLVTCIGDKLEIIDSKTESKELRSCKVKGVTSCLAVRKGQIFIGLRGSQTVLVFNNDLTKTKKIRTKGIQCGDWPWDLQVITDTIFVRTRYGRASSLSVCDGSFVSEYTDSTGLYSNACCIAVSEKMSLVAVLWYKYRKKEITVYSLDKHQSVLVFEVDNGVTRIRISDRDGMIITGNHKTGEIKMFYLEHEKTLDDLQDELVCVKKQAHEQEKMFRENLQIGQLKIKEVEAERMRLTKALQQSSKQIETLTKKLEQIQVKSAEEIETLPTELKPSKTESDRQIGTLTEELTQIRMKSTGKIHTVTEALEQTHMKSVKERGTFTDELKQSKAVSDRQVETLTEELKEARQSKTESERQIETLTEELKQTKQSKEESDRKIETLTKELEQSKAESGRHIQTLAEELKQAIQSKKESDRQIKSLTEKLKQTSQSKTVKTEEPTQVERKSHTRIEKAAEELEDTMKCLDLAETDYANMLEISNAQLNETKEKLRTSIKDLELTKQTLKETAKDRDFTKTELMQYQLDFAKEAKALKEILNQAKEATAELYKRPLKDKPSFDLEETRDEGSVLLAAEFGRLTVAIAEHLTLDDCLKLAQVCNMPASDCDTMLCVSMNESPGMKLLDMLKKRRVINMYDVTNLQKALTMLHLGAVNHTLIVPYQRKIDREQYELYKTEEMYTCEEIAAFVNVEKDFLAQYQIRDNQTSLISDTEAKYQSQSEAAAHCSEAGEEGRRSLLEGRHHHQLYTEHGIGREGGAIQLANVSLIVPPDALYESHVIALSIMNESPFPLDREVDTARMTPVIKLEPLGLMFKKSLQLNIPHSALISEPENHDVIIYSGQITKNDKDSSESIRWTEERSIPRQLKTKSVTVDIQCLTYLSASLVSQISAPPLYIVRAVPFVDGVTNTDDDIILTICFCSDNDTEYNMLLSDYKTKLPLEQYSTIQLCPRPERDEDDAGFLSVTVTSRNNTYVPDADQAVKFPISHLCTARRVSHQLRLQKNKEIERDDVQVLLKFSQAGRTPTEIFMKARIKDLMISQQSKDLLIGSVPTALQPYHELKANISSMLENHHCIQLAIYFDLTPAETERVTIDASPGRMLMKILDERENIMPRKMFGLYQGLKVCHLDKIAQLVFEFIEKNSNDTDQEKQNNEDKFTKGISENASVSQRPLQKRQKASDSSLSDQSVQTTLSSSCVSSDRHVKILTKEGYTEHEVVEALDISRNRLVIARKVLQLLGEQTDVQNTRNNVHTDQTITNVGGTMSIPGTDVRLKILPNSLPKGVEQAWIQMKIISGRLLWSQPLNSFGSNSSVVVELLPNHLQLQRCAMLTLPHCLKLKATSQNVVKVFVSHHSKDSKPHWEEKPQLDYQLEDKALTLHLDTFCWVKYEIDDKIVEAKKIQVFAACPNITMEEKITKIELGYYPDLPGAGEILRNNEDLVKVERKPFLFLREGNADLEIVGSHIEPAYWEYCTNRENVKKISFRMIAASVEKSRPFFLRRINVGTSYCVFQVSQASQANEIVELSLLLKPVGDFPTPTSRAACNAVEDKMLDCFMFLKRNLVNDWKDVGRYLEVPEADLSSFSRESSIGESIYQMLIFWQHRNASEASTERLVEALKKLDRKDLIEGITKILT